MFILCKQTSPNDIGVKKTLLNIDEISRIELTDKGEIRIKDKYRNWYSVASENSQYIFDLLIHYVCTFCSPDELE